jgi:hypothetical protein
MLHLWSLGIEEQFYFIWPPLIFFILKRNRRNFLWIILGLTVISFIVNIHYTYKDPSFAFYMPYTRFWELFFGAILAFVEINHSELKEQYKFVNTFSKWKQKYLKPDFLSLAGFVLLIYSIVLFNKSTAFPGWYAVLPVISSVLFIHAGPSAVVNRYLLSNKWMVLVGLISYPLYLWHWPILSFIHILRPTTMTEEQLVVSISIGVIASFVLAYFTYKYIEIPIRFKVREKVAVTRLSIVLLTSLATIGVLGYLVRKADGVKSRINNYEFILSSITDFSDGYKGSRFEICKSTHVVSVDLCAIENNSLPPTVALIGDSHANHLFPALAKYYKSKNQNVLLLGKNATTPFYDIAVSLRRKIQTNNDTLDYAIQSSSIHTIILSAFWANYYRKNGVVLANYPYKNTIRDLAKPEKKDQPGIFLEGLERTIQKILSANKNVIFIYDIPYLPFSLNSCLPSPLFNEISPGCKLSRAQFEEGNSDYIKASKTVLAKYPQVKTYDPIPTMCDQNWCYIYKDGMYLYSDDHHFSLKGVDILLPTFTF